MSEVYIPKNIDGLIIDLTEHDAKVRADAIDEFARAYEQVELIGCVCCEHLYDDVHCWKCVAEQLKEKKND